MPRVQIRDLLDFYWSVVNTVQLGKGCSGILVNKGNYKRAFA